MSETERIGVSLDKKLLTMFDLLIARQGYANRSEAFRDLIRNRLSEQMHDHRHDLFSGKERRIERYFIEIIDHDIDRVFLKQYTECVRYMKIKIMTFAYTVYFKPITVFISLLTVSPARQQHDPVSTLRDP